MKKFLAVALFLLLTLSQTYGQAQKRTTKPAQKTTVAKKTTTPARKVTQPARTQTKGTQKKTPVAKKSTSAATRTTKRATTAKKPSETTSISSLRSRRNALQQQISKNEAQLKAADRDVKKRLSDLAVLNGKIDKQQKVISEIQLQLDSLSSNISSLTRQYDTLSKQWDARKQKYKPSLLYLYKNDNSQNKLLFILSGHNFHQMQRRYRYVSEYAKYQQKQGLLIQKKQEQVAQVKAELERSKKNQSQKLDAQKTETEKLSKQQSEHKQQVTALQKKQKEISRVIASNKKEMAALDAKIDYYVKLAIERERKRREAEERARAEAERRRNQAQQSSPSGKGSTSSGVSKSSTGSSKAAPMQQWRSNDKDYTLSKNFTSNKGRLPMPITGSYVISAHYGNYSLSGVKGVQLNNRGINITGKPGAQARCIFPGEVSAVFQLGGLFNVLVRHGSYISVYCNLSSSAVRQGQKVSTRAVLGNVARDASGNCTLHFQLRKETATLNPESWLAR